MALALSQTRRLLDDNIAMIAVAVLPEGVKNVKEEEGSFG